jgi:hypothetical protein
MVQQVRPAVFTIWSRWGRDICQSTQRPSRALSRHPVSHGDALSQCRATTFRAVFSSQIGSRSHRRSPALGTRCFPARATRSERSPFDHCLTITGVGHLQRPAFTRTRVTSPSGRVNPTRSAQSAASGNSGSGAEVMTGVSGASTVVARSSPEQDVTSRITATAKTRVSLCQKTPHIWAPAQLVKSPLEVARGARRANTPKRRSNIVVLTAIGGVIGIHRHPMLPHR